MKTVIEETLHNNDEVGLKSLFAARWPELQVSIATIKRVDVTNEYYRYSSNQAVVVRIYLLIKVYALLH